MVMITRSRPAPGVEFFTWVGDERCVLAHLGVASFSWTQVADVVVCPPDTARQGMRQVMSELPGCGVVAARSGRHSVAVVRGVGELVVRDTGVVAGALWCYWSLVSGVSSSASSLACTCRALGILARS